MADVTHTTRHARDSSLESRIELSEKEAPSEPHNWRPPTERAVFQLPQCHRDGSNDYKEPAPICLYPLWGLQLSIPLSFWLTHSPAISLALRRTVRLYTAIRAFGYMADREKCQDGRQT
ncbi:GM19373 [Drosophila sechellia]|uniref:GM19373 n=1 Tax=Drosophila sechellia TaxID=7238 RepID=B4HH54_DROSE|nr:GM19373 [Drosophila sechellia]